MKLIASLALLAGLAFADSPVTINGLNKDFTAKCGKVNVAGTDIYNAIAKGMNLKDQNQVYTSSTGNHYTYPRYYGNSPGFVWESSQCNTNNGRLEFPVIKGGVFQDNTDQGIYRSVFWYNGQKNGDTLVGYYCGTIYHGGSNTYGCDVVTS